MKHLIPKLMEDDEEWSKGHVHGHRVCSKTWRESHTSKLVEMTDSSSRGEGEGGRGEELWEGEREEQLWDVIKQNI